ncbi:MAG TPA: ester cyclase [Chryseolinea sp.]|nr:ester cyclase [Chryseolinea sp.]
MQATTVVLATVLSLCLGATVARGQKKNMKQSNKKAMNVNEGNKETIIRFYSEMLNNRHTDQIAGIVSPLYKNAAGGGPDAIKQGAEQLLVAFPDIQWQVEEIVAEDNKVIVKQRTTGTHQGTFQGHAPSGKAFVTEGFALYKFSHGKIISHQVMTDRYSFLQQIGVL